MERLIILILLLSGCIGGEPPGRSSPIINIYNDTLKTTTSTIQKTTSTSSTVTSTTSTSTSSTTSYTTSTIRRTAPRLYPPDLWRKCELNTQCLLFTDCCGINGRQYALNRYRDQEFNKLKGDCNKTLACIVTPQLQSMRYKYAKCENGLCKKTYDYPTN